MQRTREMGLTDRLQNFNLISREHLYGDTNQTSVKINQDCESAEMAERKKEQVVR